MSDQFGEASLNTDELRALQEFDDAWARGDKPAWHLFQKASRRWCFLRELFRADMKQKLQLGLPARVEDYLQECADWDSGETVLSDLLAVEFQVRQDLRSDPTIDTDEGRLALLRIAVNQSIAPDSRERDVAPPATEAGAAPSPATVPSSRATTPHAGPVIAGYEILGRLGEGGMGVVYKARQTALKRTVAIKMILAGPDAGPQHLQRFQREAEAVGRLQHPNIVQIYEVGGPVGAPFFSMEYVAGGTLEDKVRGTPMPSREAAELVRVLAQAVQCAHARGVIHRDLKPANVLVTSEGVPKISDFGLAKQLGSDHANTRSGVLVGTPSYMSPEQAAGKTREIGTAADIYALGAILYELLTGRPPFRAAQLMDTLRQVISEQPVPPRLLNSKVERDLETICLTCLSKEPSDRYGSAQDLAEDLHRFLRHEAIVARPTNFVEQLMRTVASTTFEPELGSWATMLLLIGVTLLVSHLVMLGLLLAGVAFPGPIHQNVRLVQFVLIGWFIWRYRPVRRVRSMSRIEEQLWALWIGFGASCLTVFIVGYLQHSPKGVGRLVFYPLPLYPYWAILSGLAFFAMGSAYSGRFFISGMAFFVLAVLMPLASGWGPLVFGLLWSIVLIDTAIRLRKVIDSQAAS